MTATPFHAYYTARILDSLQDDDKFIPTFASSDIKVYPYQVGAALFATRSPYRPNPIGLSSVEIIEIKNGEIFVKGADLLNDTPIYDIKPYIPYTDCHSDASGGFSDDVFGDNLKVEIPDELKEVLGEDYDKTVAVLVGDPRPHYQNDPDRIYAFEFSKYHIEFRVENNLLTVTKIIKTGEKSV